MLPRLLIITNLYPTPWENLRGTFNFQQFNRLAEHLDIQVVVPVSWKDRFKHRNSLHNKLAEHPLQDRVSYPLYWYMPGFLRGSYGWSMWASLQLQCRKLIADFKPDYLLSSWAYPEGVAGTRIARALGIPAFVKVHGSDINITAQHPDVKPQIRDWGQKVAGVASVSFDLKQKLEKLGVPEFKIHVIYNGIDHQRFHPSSREAARKMLRLDDAPFLLYVGDLKARKGCMDLLQAFLKLENRHPDLKLYIAGTGVMHAALQQHIEQTGVQDKVSLLGKVQHADLHHWYNAASLTCLPSYNEGVPNVLLESMACGTPVVATNVGGIPEVVNSNCGLLTEPGDVDALAQALDDALEENWNQKRIHQHATGFSWEENTRKMLNMFLNSGDPGK